MITTPIELPGTWAYGAGILPGGRLLETPWMPPPELTVRLRAVVTTWWLRSVQRARLVHGGQPDQRCRAWDSSDRLVARVSQPACRRAS